MAAAQGPVPRGGTPPALNDHVVRQIAVHHLVPTHGPLAKLAHRSGHPGIEVGLNVHQRGQAMVGHEGLNTLAGRPPRRVHLVTPEVQVAIRKHLGHLRQQLGQGRVDGLASRIQAGLVDTEAPGRRGHARPPFRMRHQPAGGVAGNIDFRHYANAAVGRVLNELGELAPGVVALTRELRILLAGKPERLVVREVQVQNVQLHLGHGVEGAQQRVHAEMVPGHVQEQAAPRKPRRIVHGDCAEAPRRRRQLKQGLQPMQDPPLGLGHQPRSRIGDRKLVGLRLTQLRVIRTQILTVDLEGHFPTGLPVKPAEAVIQAFDCPVQARRAGFRKTGDHGGHRSRPTRPRGKPARQR